MLVCLDCIEISKRPADWARPGEKKRLHEIQCPACGAWWRAASPKTIRFDRLPSGAWYQRWRYFGYWCYVPVECQQHGCRAHAQHKLQGKRKWRCDRHAGVCVVA